MVTRAKAVFRVLPDRLVLAASMSPSTSSPILTSVHVVVGDPNWSAAMEDEYEALMSNGLSNTDMGTCILRIWIRHFIEKSDTWIHFNIL
jgi:hypothetical protein